MEEMSSSGEHALGLGLRQQGLLVEHLFWTQLRRLRDQFWTETQPTHNSSLLEAAFLSVSIPAKTSPPTYSFHAAGSSPNKLLLICLFPALGPLPLLFPGDGWNPLLQVRL